MQDISLQEFQDANTVELLRRVTNGTHYATAVITAAPQGTNPKIVYALEDVLVNSVAEGASGGETQAIEYVSLNFAKVTWTHTDAAGNSMSGSWQSAPRIQGLQTGRVANRGGCASHEVMGHRVGGTSRSGV